MRNIFGRKLLIVLLTLLCVKLTAAQSNELWKSVIPLVSSREQVERVIGPPMSKGRDIYDTPEARITLWYGRLKSATYSCIWNVAEDTVVTMLISPKKRPLLTQLGFDLSGFKKEQTLNDEVWIYVDEKRGIRIETYDSPDNPIDKIVISVQLSPTEKDRKKKCQ